MGYPTETVYGLAACALDGKAVEKLCRLKRRPTGKAISVLVSDRDMLRGLVGEVPKAGLRLMERFWPGPLTLVFDAAPGLPSGLLGHGGSIAVRISSNPIATALVAQCGFPITSSSANRSGRPAARSAEEVKRVFGDGVDLVLDGGPSGSDVPSTVARVSADGVRVLREGRISSEEVQRAVEGAP